jgi:dTMP kinase
VLIGAAGAIWVHSRPAMPPALPVSAPAPTTLPGPLAVPTSPSSASAPRRPDPSCLRAYAGRFIALEGPDGSGKSTQIKRLTGALDQLALPYSLVREPGGTPVGEKIRSVLLTRADEGLEMSVRTEMLLYMASRAELVDKVIRPALSRGELVIADRYIASTLAYQGAAGGLAGVDISAVARVATRNLLPDVYVVFDIDEVAAAKRLSPLLDRMEAKGAAFHRKVRQGYLEQAKHDPARYMVIDASRNEDQVWASLLTALADRSPALPPRRAIDPPR